MKERGKTPPVFVAMLPTHRKLYGGNTTTHTGELHAQMLVPLRAIGGGILVGVDVGSTCGSFFGVLFSVCLFFFLGTRTKTFGRLGVLSMKVSVRARRNKKWQHWCLTTILKAKHFAKTMVKSLAPCDVCVDPKQPGTFYLFWCFSFFLRSISVFLILFLVSCCTFLGVVCVQ